jgi:Protein of unknown function (DUF3224)
MTSHATGTFDIDSWHDEPYDEAEGASLRRASLTKTFHGEVEGRSAVEMLMAQAQEGSAAYVAFERLDVRVHGRAGTFVLQHCASGTRDQRSATWTVVPDSGTGELRSLRGTARIVNEPDGGHTFELDYELDGVPAAQAEVNAS